jgi:hypothetical protein
MSVTQTSLPISTPRARREELMPVAVPVALVALLVGLIVAFKLVSADGNLTAFIAFGHLFTGQTHPPAGALLEGPTGYDGQFFWVLGHDPLLLHQSTIAQMRATSAPELFRIQRLGYPLLAFLLSAGQSAALPAVLLAINVIVLLAVTAGVGAWLRRRSISPLWALAITLSPGMLLPVLRDLSDPLSTACVIAGVLLWQARRRWPAAVALTVAVLTREVMIVLVVAIAVEVSVRGWRERDSRAAWLAITREACPVVLVPAAVFAVWQVYVTIRAGGLIGTSAAMLPFTNMVQEIAHAVPVWGGVGVVDIMFVLLMAIAVGLSVRCLWAGITPFSVAAGALCVSVVLPQFGDYWSDTRLAAPLFAVLLLDGLQRRDRAQVVVGTTAAGLSVLFLLAAL